MAALLAGCSTTTSAPPVTPPDPAPSPLSQTATKPSEANLSGPAVDQLNDKAFRLLQEQKWEESAALSRQALALDEQSSAAWFNLGKAQLAGAGSKAEAVQSFRRASLLTKASSADVEYNLARALWLAGESDEALAVIAQAINQFPGDKDFAALRDQIRGSHDAKQDDVQTLTADLDGDDRPDTFAVQGDANALAAKGYGALQLKVTSADGQVLYEGSLRGQILRLKVLQMPDGVRLAHLELEGCPSHPQNQFLAYSPVTKQVTDPWGTGDMCAAWSYDEKDGKFKTSYRLYFPVAGVTERRWEHGKFVDGESALVIYSGVQASRLPALLSDIAGSAMEVQGTKYLFATPALYQEFRDKTAGRKWVFEEASPVQGDTMKLTIKDGEKAAGSVTLTLNERGGQAVITAMIWSP